MTKWKIIYYIGFDPTIYEISESFTGAVMLEGNRAYPMRPEEVQQAIADLTCDRLMGRGPNIKSIEVYD